MANDLISRKAAVKLLREKARGYFVSMFATSGECHVARVVATERQVRSRICQPLTRNLWCIAVHADTLRRMQVIVSTGKLTPIMMTIADAAKRNDDAGAFSVKERDEDA